MEPGRFVARLTEYVRENQCNVMYLECGEDGPPHDKIFTQRVVLNGVAYPDGVGKSKKEARNAAAKYALERLEGQQDTDNAVILSSPQCNRFTEANFVNFVGLVNHYCQVKHLHPKYNEEWISGPSHYPQFLCRLAIDSKEYAVGEGKNKKEARQRAAQLAWSALQEQSDWDSKVSLRSTCSDDSGPATTPEPLESSDAAMDISDSVMSKDSSRDQSMEQSVSDPSTQSRFTSDFDCMECLGEGGFGAVYKARDKMLNKYYAVKIVAYHEKALDEAKILSDLHNKHIVRYYTCWKEDSKYEQETVDRSTDSVSSDTSHMSSSQYLYIQMELCDTQTLRDWIDERNQRTEQVSKRREDSLQIAQQVVTGVEYIHSEKLIHRDLKPENIMFGGDGAVKIGDFGLVTAEIHDNPETSLKRTIYKGTSSYMAPEQKIDPKYDHKVDIFALGLIYFELLWKISTVHEKVEIWSNVRSQKFPEGFTERFFQEAPIIKQMLSERPEHRPEASSVKGGMEKWTQQHLGNPANIMFGGDGAVKIGDFGLVTAEDPETLLERTKSRGTPNYMAPEQKNNLTYDRKVDIFALGLIFFEPFWKISTGHERLVIWEDVRHQRFLSGFTDSFFQEAQIMKLMLSEKPED